MARRSSITELVLPRCYGVDKSALSLDELTLEAIAQAVDAVHGNISEASRALGISRNTIYRKLRWKNCLR